MREILLLCPFGKSEGGHVSKERSLSGHRQPSSRPSKTTDTQVRGDVREFADRMLEPGMRDKEQKRRKFPKLVVGGGVLKGLAGEGWSGREKKNWLVHA